MAGAAVARVLTYFAIIIQSYFKWSPDSDESLPQPTSRGLYTPGNHLAGLILARAGSKGIPRKNMVDLHGKPLIYWALQAMVDSGVFTSIWVSTDDQDLSEWVAKHFPSVFIHSRAAYTATDAAPSIIAVQEMLSFHPEIDAIGLVQATSPFIRPIYLQEAKTLLSKFESVFSTYRSQGLRWKAVNDSHREVTSPVNFDPKNRPRRQDWAGEMIENGMFYFAVRDLIVNQNLFQGSRSGYVEIPSRLSLEIDSPEDLELAEFLMRKVKVKETVASPIDKSKTKNKKTAKDNQHDIEL